MIPPLPPRFAALFASVFAAAFASALVSPAPAGDQTDPPDQTAKPLAQHLYQPAQTELPIRAIERFDLRDPTRDKTIQLRITFPNPDPAQAKGPWPVIVWCHGALGSKDGYLPLTEAWAARGYVVIQPTFGDSIKLMAPDQRKRLRSIGEAVNSMHVKRQWAARPKDVAFILDSLKTIEQKNESLRGRIDHDRIGVGGHSYGAHTAMLVAGTPLYAPRGRRSIDFRDKRPAAFVIVSPQGPGGGFTEKSYAALDRPALMITGDEDGTPIKGRENQKGAWRKKAYEHSPEGPRYLLWVHNARHDFGGISGVRYPTAGPENPEHLAAVRQTALALWDAYLKDNDDARSYLTRTPSLPGTARLTHKLQQD